MAPFDPSTDLPDISADQPAGENLEFDPAFIELERLAQGKPEQQYGSTIVPAEEPEWKEVLLAAQELMGRTYDLRVMAQLGVARLHRDGVAGFADALGVVRSTLESRWQSVHPQLDPEDDDDPMLRANALLRLAAPVRVMKLLRTLPLARSERAGSVSWRDIAVSTGAIEADGEVAKVPEAVIAAAFRETDATVLAGLRAALERAAEHGAAIPAAFDAHAGFGTGPDLSALTKLLRDMVRMMDAHAVPVAAEAEATAGEAEAEVAVGAPVAVAPAARAAPVMSIATMGPPTNRADAGRLLELVIEYYERNEPSSPLPLLLGRARRLMDMSFMDILREVAPDAISQAEMVTGRERNEAY